MFDKLRTEEHMVLLMMYHDVQIPKAFAHHFKALEEATLVYRQEIPTENGIRFQFKINKRGIAFVHQQRDPYDLNKFQTATSAFLTKLEKVAVEGKAINKVHNAIFADALANTESAEERSVVTTK